MKNVDILIKPDISGYSASSFNTEAAKVLMKRGEDAARKVLPELIRMRDSLGYKTGNKNPASTAGYPHSCICAEN